MTVGLRAGEVNVIMGLARELLPYSDIIWPILEYSRIHEVDDFKYHTGRCFLEQFGFKERKDIICVMAQVLNENQR